MAIEIATTRPMMKMNGAIVAAIRSSFADTGTRALTVSRICFSSSSPVWPFRTPTTVEAIHPPRAGHPGHLRHHNTGGGDPPPSARQSGGHAGLAEQVKTPRNVYGRDEGRQPCNRPH